MSPEHAQSYIFVRLSYSALNFTLHTLTRNYLELHVESFISLLHRNLADEYWSSEHFLTELPRKWELSQYILNKEGLVIGFLIASEKSDSVHIHKFVVENHAQSKGLGALLLNRLLSLTHKNITLKVNSNNTQAISFYKKHSFSVSTQTDTSYTMTLQRNG